MKNVRFTLSLLVVCCAALLAAVRLPGPGGEGSAAPTGCAALVQTGMVACYQMDEGSGDTLNDLGPIGTNDGRLGSASGADGNDPDWITSPDDGLDFTAANVDMVLTAGTSSLSGTYTVQLLYNSDTNASNPALFGSNFTDAVSRVLVLSSNKYRATMSTSGNDDTVTSATAGTAQVVSTRRDSSEKVDLFVNNGAANRLFADAAKAGTIVHSQLGKGGSSLLPFDGKMFFWVAYNTALSDAEVASNYAAIKAFKSGVTLP